MFKLIAVFAALCAVASAGVISSYGLGYGGYSSIAAPALISHAPIYKSYAAPVIAQPLATSYANTYRVATKSIPIVQAAPLVHAAPAVIAAPALHTTSTYHGGLGLHGLGYSGYGSYLH